MKYYWSKYNSIFRDDKYGYFLYNSLSNKFFELNEDNYNILLSLQKEKKISQNKLSVINKSVFDILLKTLILVGENVEKLELLKKQHQRNKISYDTSNLTLTICPTLGCNFTCSYCFENSQNDFNKMDNNVLGQILKFVKKFEKAKDLSITWYGGEPTLAFEVIKTLTNKIKLLDINFKEASIITNGYLLNKKKISSLNDLNINSVQVTIDGKKEIHDSRRFLLSGKPTYEKIIKNIQDLMNSPYEGSCDIRVNIDNSNYSEYVELRHKLLKIFQNKKVFVYAGRVETFNDNTCGLNCNLSSNEWTDFTINLFRNNSEAPSEHIYPNGNLENVCSANSINSFVIGPNGELYKCWEDVGKNEYIVGNIFEDNHITNPELISMYDIGTNPYLDNECIDCSILPICGGGCVNRRLRDKFFNEKGMNYCSLYKDNLVMYLMEYYDKFLTKEIINALTKKEKIETIGIKGFRLVSPPANK